jgi:hypothetical protein
MKRALTVGVVVLVVGMLSWGAAEAATVYFNDFETAVGPALSTTFAGGLAIDRTPTGARGFLGRNDQSPILGVGEGDLVALTLNGLAAHNNVTLSFDFYGINSLDGYGPGGGTAENYRVEVGGGPLLLNTNFANHSGSSGQAYPDSIPTVNTPRTGADENNTLGYLALNPALAGDSVYNLSFSFPHSDSSFIVTFTYRGLQELADESWGIDNLRVETDAPTGTVPEPTTLLLLGSSLAGLAAIRRHFTTK